MTRTLQIALLLLFGCASYACLEVGNAARQAKRDEPQLAEQSSKFIQHADEVLRQIDQNEPREAQEVLKSTAKINDLVAHLDCSLNIGGKLCKTKAILPQLAADAELMGTDEKSLNLAVNYLSETGKSLSTLVDDQRLNLSGLEQAASKSVTKIGELSDSITSQTGPILSNVREFSSNAADGTAKADSILAHGDHIAAHYDHEITGPVNKAKAVLHGIESGIGRVLGGLL